jgi:hypothetical protein
MSPETDNNSAYYVAKTIPRSLRSDWTEESCEVGTGNNFWNPNVKGVGALSNMITKLLRSEIVLESKVSESKVKVTKVTRQKQKRRGVIKSGEEV